MSLAYIGRVLFLAGIVLVLVGALTPAGTVGLGLVFLFLGILLAAVDTFA